MLKLLPSENTLAVPQNPDSSVVPEAMPKLEIPPVRVRLDTPPPPKLQLVAVVPVRLPVVQPSVPPVSAKAMPVLAEVLTPVTVLTEIPLPTRGPPLPL